MGHRVVGAPVWGIIKTALPISLTLLLPAIPAFALAYIVQGVFAQELGWFPIRGLFGGWRALVCPRSRLR